MQMASTSSQFTSVTMVPVRPSTMTRMLAKSTETVRPQKGVDFQNQSVGSRQLKMSVSMPREIYKRESGRCTQSRQEEKGEEGAGRKGSCANLDVDDRFPV